MTFKQCHFKNFLEALSHTNYLAYFRMSEREKLRKSRITVKTKEEGSMRRLHARVRDL